jgi:hypothetical protein
MKNQLNKLNGLQKIGLFCIFSIFLDRAVRGAGLPFDLYYYYFILLIFMGAMLAKGYYITLPPAWYSKTLGILFLISLVVCWYYGLLGFEYFKQVFGITFTSIAYFNVIKVYQFNVRKIFHYYLLFAFLVALHGVIANLLHMVGIHITLVYPISGFRFRESGIMGEPFYLAMALTPAIVYYICYFKRTWTENKYRFVIILLCYIVTYSSTALFGIGLAMFFSLYLNDFFSVRSNRFIFIPLLAAPVVIFVVILINNVSLINERYNDTTSLFLSNEIDVREAGKSNSSTFALYSNYVIAKESFLNNPLFGSGLGSHPLIYEKTFLKYFPANYLKGYGAQNQQDANSRFLRLMSETGLTGLVLFLIAVIGFMAPKSGVVDVGTKELAAINYGILVYLILGLIRNGNYINVGFFLFFFLYYYSYLPVSQASLKHRFKRFNPINGTKGLS